MSKGDTMGLEMGPKIGGSDSKNPLGKGVLGFASHTRTTERPLTKPSDAPPPTEEEKEYFNKKKPRKPSVNTGVEKAAIVGVGLGAIALTGGVSYGIYRAVDAAFANHIAGNVEGGKGGPNLETNPEEIFDPTATKQVITLKNTIAMSPEEYEDIVPPTVDPQHPEIVNVFFPIQLAEGSGEREIVIEKRVERPSLSGGKRSVNVGKGEGEFPVKSTHVITKGLMPGDKLIASASGTIVRGGTDEPDTNNVIDLKNGGFRIETTDEKGNHSLSGFGGRKLKLKLTKNIPASTTIHEEVRIGDIKTIGSRLQEHPVPVREGEEIGIFTKVGKDPDLDGEFAITSTSLVTGENGKTQGGSAEIMINIAPNGQLITPKANQ